ncbi:MAG TPA: M23 family metallopeptidase [Elusimicrobiales bacterium]|nr:M23 family metallopeptidase [Elusimicrobiales bacterium]
MKKVKPIALDSGNTFAPDPISIAPSSRKKRHGKSKKLLAAITAAGLIALISAFAWKLRPAPAVFCYPQKQFQGGILELRAHVSSSPEKLACELDGGTYPFYALGDEEFRALVPVKLFSKPGLHYARVTLKTRLGTRELAKIPVAIRRGSYPHIKLTLHLKSTQSKEDRDMLIASARQILLQTLALETPVQHWHGHFLYPLRGRLSATYGERRTVNGKSGSVHYGLDIAAPAGTDVVAANSGVVALTADFPLQGKIVLLDHGQGIFSAYLHMSEILVQEGAPIEQGQPLGRTGSTGRSTGPHLHWSMYLHGIPVSPLELVDRSF